MKDLGDISRMIQKTIERNNKFLGNMAYQMRTTLNAITGFSEILSVEDPKPEQKEYIDEINRASKALAILVNDVIEFTKINPNKKVVKKYCDTLEILNEVRSVIGPRAEARGVELSITEHGSMPESILTNNRCLRECLTRLADITLKFADDSDVEIRVVCQEEGKVRFEFFCGKVHLTRQERMDLFEPFSENLNNIYRDIEDTGLGFSIVAKLAETIGASLKVASQTEGYLLSLTVDVGVVTGIQRSKLVEEYIQSHNKKRVFKPKKIEGKAKILVAEDNISNQAVIKILLNMMGCEVDMAENGVVAVEKAKNNSYDIVLMDIRMPVMDGYKATELIRKSGVLIPVVALTAMDESELSDSENQELFDGHIAKPISGDKVRKVLKNFLVLPVEEQKV